MCQTPPPRSCTTMGHVGDNATRLSAIRTVFAATATPALSAELASSAASPSLVIAMSMPCEGGGVNPVHTYAQGGLRPAPAHCTMLPNAGQCEAKLANSGPSLADSRPSSVENGRCRAKVCRPRPEFDCNLLNATQTRPTSAWIWSLPGQFGLRRSPHTWATLVRIRPLSAGLAQFRPKLCCVLLCCVAVCYVLL